MDEINLVQDDEELYRNVRGGPESMEYSCDDTGKLRIQPGAFRDRCKKPSVDRAKLIGFNPSRALLDETNGIVSLMAGDVRAITEAVTTTEDGTVAHAVDVVYVPTPERRAHAQITVDPEFFGTRSKREKVFKFLQKALARLATRSGWTLDPGAK